MTNPLPLKEHVSFVKLSHILRWPLNNNVYNNNNIFVNKDNFKQNKKIIFLKLKAIYFFLFLLTLTVTGVFLEK